MSTFFDFKIDSPTEGGGTLCVAWNRTAPVVAVASKNGTVDLYQEEGEKLASLKQPRGCGARLLSWHPRYKLLLMGWEDGLISVWSIVDDKVSPYEEHAAAVTVLGWTADGTRLVSGAEDGICLVWKWDKHKGLSISHKYDLRSPVTHCVFRHDMSLQSGNVGNTFFIATKQGAVFFADDYGHHHECFHETSAILVLLLYEESNTIVVINKSLVFSRHRIQSNGSTKVKMKVKMSTSAADAMSMRAAWTLPGLLATVASESMVRFWNQQNNENYVLSLSDIEGHGEEIQKDRLTSVCYNTKKQVLAAGTEGGRIVMWSYKGGLNSVQDSDWEVLNVKSLDEYVEDVVWGPGSGLLAAKLQSNVSILVESSMQYVLSNGLAALQISRTGIQIEDRKMNEVFTAETKIRIKSIDLNSTNLVVCSGKEVEVYHIVGGCHLEHSFQSSAAKVCLSKHQEGDDSPSSLYILQNDKILVTNLSGTAKKTLSFTDSEGVPRFLDVCATVMCAYTDENVLKLWNVGGRVVKEMRLGKRFEGDDVVGVPVMVKTNCDGTRIGIVANVASRTGTTFPASTIFVYEVDNGVTSTFDFGAHRFPVSVHWDPVEPKLLCVETASVRGRSYLQDAKEVASSPFAFGATKVAEREASLLFATPVNGVMVQDSFPLIEPLEHALGICVPYIYFSRKRKESSGGKRSIVQTMRDFIGMEDADEETRNALIDFSYFLTIGNMDEAFKAVKLIKSASVWENMANMCVKTKRLDVAVVCLGNMGHARGSRAVREAMAREPELEAQVAMVAIQLGLLDDAARLYIECGRFDLLNYLYQSSNQWEKAVEIARTSDRLHRRTTFFQFGRYLEAIGDFKSAIQAFERSETHRFEIPRMLHSTSNFGMLEKYVKDTKDIEIKQWWARFMEMSGHHDKALMFYEQAGDYRSAIKILCFHNDYQKAVQVANTTRDPAACYHLARQCEANGKIQEAMHFYGVSERYSHAIQIAKANNLDDETLIGLALRSTKPLMVDVARYYEDKGKVEQAVNLYHKGGYVSKAIDLCFQTEQFDALRAIAEKLDRKSDPELLDRCANFFMEHEQHDKAVSLLICGEKNEQALDMCIKHNVPISEEMAEQLTPPKAPKDDVAAAKNRVDTLVKLAACLNEQKSYHLACKKYTQAGDKVTAMKCLLRSGDTDKIKFFANMSKSKEIYVLAAHYLQRLDWKDPEIRKSIITYYTKGRAYDSLALFYGECAQVEIDKYHNYEQAVNALKEAIRFMTKAEGASSIGANNQQYIADWNSWVPWMEKFVQARKIFEARENPEEVVRICQELLGRTDIEKAVRAGHVFVLLIQLAHQQGDMRQGYKFIEMMQSRNISLEKYLNAAMVEQICQAVGVRLELGGNQGQEGGGVEESIPAGI